MTLHEREAWHSTVHGVTNIWTRLSNWTEMINFSKPVESYTTKSELMYAY